MRHGIADETGLPGPLGSSLAGATAGLADPGQSWPGKSSASSDG
jgi:hypothetical protein